MGSLFDDLRNAPKRKPSSKRSQQDAATFRTAQESRWEAIREGSEAAEGEVDKFKKAGVDWGIEFEE